MITFDEDSNEGVLSNECIQKCLLTVSNSQKITNTENTLEEHELFLSSYLTTGVVTVGDESW